MNRSYFYGILSVIFMAFVPTVNKFALGSTNSVIVSFWNASFAFIIVGLVLAFKRSSVELNELPKMLLVGVMNCLGMLALLASLSFLSPSLVAFINRLYIVFSIVFSIFILKERVKIKEWYFIVGILLSLFMFLYKGWDVASVKGIGLGVVSALFFSISNLMVKKKLKHVNSLSLILVINVTSAVFSLALVWFNGLSVIDITLNGMLFTLLASLLGSTLGLLLFYRSIKGIPFVNANIIRSFGPVLAFLIALPFFPVQLTALNWSGVVCLSLSLLGLSIYQSNLFSSKSSSIKMFSEILPIRFDSVLVLLNNRDKWLFVKNKKRGWEFPGGHCKQNETIEETAKREVFEESGAKISKIKTLGYYILPNGHTTVATVAKVDSMEKLPEGFETNEVKLSNTIPTPHSWNDGVYDFFIKLALSSNKEA